jgi:hypothetical protein
MRIETPPLALPIKKSEAWAKSPGWPTLAGAVVLAIYLVLLPYINRTWRTTGDEPHYLLAAHSLVYDLDYDLTNNYEQLDYLNFYFSEDIIPQVRLNASGQQILDHYPALPFLIAPAYALGGQAGVLFFQALLGSILAAFTFKLSLAISLDRWASLLATFFVTLTPPLLLYHYLVYPELVTALLVTIVLYFLLTQDKPALAAAITVSLSLALLPWLNRRFIPLACLLALLAWWSWRSRESKDRQRKNKVGAALSQLFSSSSGLILLIVLLSTGGLIWFNSQLQAPSRVDIALPAAGTAFWLRLVRGIGWLLDQQRGLFIYGPIYIAALWGLPLLLETHLRGRQRHWFILLPFFLSLGTATLAAGFWTAWEVGPRFLVVALPALAPLLALAWRTYRHNWLWQVMLWLLFGLSLLNSGVIIQNPELPYKSSLPLFYGERLALPLTDWLPDLADNINLAPVEGGGIAGMTTERGDLHWRAALDRPVTLIKTEPLHTMPYGHYLLTWPVRLGASLSPEVELIRISINLLGGGSVFNGIIKAGDLVGAKGETSFEAQFLNTNVDRWRTPMILHAVTTGRAEVEVGSLQLSPDPFYALFLPYLYLVLLAGVATWSGYRFKKVGPAPTALTDASFSQVGSGTSGYETLHSLRQAQDATQDAGIITRVSSSGVRRTLTWLLLALPLLAGLYWAYTQTRPSHTYDAAELYHFVGQPITDPQARDGQAWSVDPAVDPPQKAIYGPFDFYEPGLYQVIFRVKLLQAAEAHQEVARLEVNATANFEPLLTQSLLAKHFSKIDLYHDLVLTVDNPRRQALSFELYYLAVAPMVIDELTITRLKPLGE